MFNIIYYLIFLVFALKLLMYHFVLIISNLTTKDEINKGKMFIVNPYKYSDLFKNIKESLCPLLSNVSFLEQNDVETTSTKILNVKLK